MRPGSSCCPAVAAPPPPPPAVAGALRTPTASLLLLPLIAASASASASATAASAASRVSSRSTTRPRIPGTPLLLPAALPAAASTSLPEVRLAWLSSIAGSGTSCAATLPAVAAAAATAVAVAEVVVEAVAVRQEEAMPPALREPVAPVPPELDGTLSKGATGVRVVALLPTPPSPPPTLAPVVEATAPDGVAAAGSSCCCGCSGFTPKWRPAVQRRTTVMLLLVSVPVLSLLDDCVGTRRCGVVGLWSEGGGSVRGQIDGVGLWHTVGSNSGSRRLRCHP